MSTSKKPMVQGMRLQAIILSLKFKLLRLVFRHAHNWKEALGLAKKIDTEIKQYLGPKGIHKMAHVGDRYYWDMYDEGWPSEIFNRNVRQECDRINSPASAQIGMRNVLFGITTKCPLQCEHCYEWNNLNLKERLSFTDLQTIIEKIIEHGASQIHFGGGEPMMRFTEILALLKSYSHQVGFWIVTSGYNVTEERARQLKESGLTGICVSLDHHEELKHNEFRHHRTAYTMAQNAVAAANCAGLVTSLSLCATKEFVNEENLHAYLDLAKRWGVSFIQILEPRAVGHFDGKPIHLSIDQKNLLENFFLKVNSDASFRSYPIIIYHEYYQPTLGCRGAGKGSLYIDPLGEVHACPFCRNSVGNVLNESFEKCVAQLLGNGCALPPIKAIQKTEPIKKMDEVLTS
jgi:MoaA/NifB/PqqE/SkfB family radical SAM enzyme